MVNDSNTKASAIVAAFNERPRIGSVLEALSRTSSISEIIVVDDGSSDGTADFVKQSFPNAKVFVNAINQGKAYSMNRGVEKSTNDIIFFCDADLLGLTPESVDAIVLPIVENKYDMFIGIRDNIMQKSFLPFALNSGERAMRKSVWQKLPDFYKHRFRIEAGLNSMVYFTSDLGMGHRVLPYRQPLKEKKWGFFRGQRQRLGMNIDVVAGWVRAFFEFFLFGYVPRLFMKKKTV